MITFVTATYNEKKEANVFLNSLLLQDNPNWKCVVYADVPNEYIKNLISEINDDRITYHQNVIKTGFWGHKNRKYALQNLVQTDFVLQSSIQDYYLPVTVSNILNFSKTHDFIYFNCLHNGFGYGVLDTTPKICNIDWGCFAVRTEIAKSVDIHDTESRVTDGIFVENCMRYDKIRVTKINKILLIHN